MMGMVKKQQEEAKIKQRDQLQQKQKEIQA